MGKLPGTGPKNHPGTGAHTDTGHERMGPAGRAGEGGERTRTRCGNANAKGRGVLMPCHYPYSAVEEREMSR